MRRKLSQSSPLHSRPLWRRALLFAGACVLLLACIGFYIASQPAGARFHSGIAWATPQTYMVGCDASSAGIRMFCHIKQPFGIPLRARRVAFAGFRVSKNERLQGSDVNVSVPWWFLIAFLGLSVALAGRDLCAGVRRQRRIIRGLCEQCGYDSRATPERCPECGASSTGRPAAA
jgi:hypothetical protein